MTDLESRLKQQLSAEATGLPDPTFSVHSAADRGRRRRRRARAVSGLGAAVAVIGFSLAAVWFSDSLPGRQSTVVADQPQSLDDRPESTETPVAGGEARDRSVLDVDPQPRPPATTPTVSTAEPRPAPEPGSDRSEPEPQPEPESPTRSTADAIQRLPNGSVLFSSDNENCRTLEDGRAHPDWIEGQPGTGRNEDGTPTHGFAFNSGDSIGGDIDWGFVEHPVARSGSCVISMTINRADRHADAIRLFRRYDQTGRPIPADAYYSVWLYFPDDVVFDNRGTIDGADGFGFWNVFQIKNDVVDVPGGDGRSMSAISFNAGRLPDEPFMSLNAYSKVRCGTADDCPEAHNIDPVEPVPIPTDRWVHFELHLRSRSDNGGSLEVWQDGRRILQYQGQTERASTERRTWSLVNMGQLHHEPSATVLADDPVISTAPIHPELFPEH